MKYVGYKGNTFTTAIDTAKGMLIYTDSQCVAVQLFIPKKQDNYIAYYGYYEFDLDQLIVTHRISSATSSELIDVSVQRKVKFHQENYISLSNTHPEKIDTAIPIYRELFWRRISNEM